MNAPEPLEDKLQRISAGEVHAARARAKDSGRSVYEELEAQSGLSGRDYVRAVARLFGMSAVETVQMFDWTPAFDRLPLPRALQKDCVLFQAAGGDAALRAAGGEQAVRAAGGDAAVRAAGGDAAVRAAGGDAAVRAAGGDAAVRAAGGDAAVRAAGGEQAVRAAGGEHAAARLFAVIPDPFDAALQDWVEAQAGGRVDMLLALRADIHAYLARQEASVRATDSLMGDAGNRASAGESGETLSLRSISEDASPVVKIVNSTLYDALKEGASDIHLRRTPRGMQIKYRIDGVLVPLTHIDGDETAEQMVSRIKVLAELDIAERRVPQDGKPRWFTRSAASTSAFR